MDKNSLLNKKCVPCETGEGKLSDKQIEEFLQATEDWTVSNDQLFKKFEFKDFVKAMHFINQVAGLAESEGHHPDIYIFYNKVELRLSTHAAGGITENDFILAVKMNQLENKLK